MTDSNYQQVFNYFRHCYFLTQSLISEQRKAYLDKMNELLQETWYDFIWRSDLSTEELVKMRSAKENLMRQSFEEIGVHSRQVSGSAVGYNASDWAILWIATSLAIAFIVISIIVKFAMTKKTKKTPFCEQCTSEIDVRRMNSDPPEISYSSEDENHVVYYETHFLMNKAGNNECSIPSQIHIKMCCSHENCRKNPEIVMQKCKTHNKTSSKSESCRNSYSKTSEDRLPFIYQKKNYVYSKILNFFKGNLCQEYREPLEGTNSSYVTSSGVSMSDEFIPVFEAVRQKRLGKEKERSTDLSQTDTFKSTTTFNTDS